MKSLRKAIGAAFLLVLLLLGARTCQSEMASAEIRFLVEPSAPDLVELEAQLWRDGEDTPVGYFRATPRAGVDELGTWALTADAGDYDLVLELDTEGGHESQRRAVSIRDGARITVRLSTEAGRTSAEPH